jgi:hypothetical protein
MELLRQLTLLNMMEYEKWYQKTMFPLMLKQSGEWNKLKYSLMSFKEKPSTTDAEG